jgi:hypothetical protein
MPSDPRSSRRGGAPAYDAELRVEELFTVNSLLPK